MAINQRWGLFVKYKEHLTQYASNYISCFICLQSDDLDENGLCEDCHEAWDELDKTLASQIPNTDQEILELKKLLDKL